MQSFTFEAQTRIGKIRFNERGIGESHCPDCGGWIRVEASSIYTMAGKVMIEGWKCENCGEENEPYTMADFYDDQFAEGDSWEDELEE